jgi:hypothetical protein
VTSLPSSNKVEEVEWSSEPLPEDGSVGLRISRQPSNIPQLDGARDKDLEESPKETKHTDEEKESQTDIFLTLNPNGGVLDSFLNILYNNPPPTVYHPVLGIGEYHSTDNYKELKTNNYRKAYCYRFGNGELVDI